MDRYLRYIVLNEKNEVVAATDIDRSVHALPAVEAATQLKDYIKAGCSLYVMVKLLTLKGEDE